MARAIVLSERQADGGWRPTAVLLATPRHLQGRALPGDPDRASRLATILSDSRPPPKPFSAERGTFEDWVDWAVGLPEVYPGGLNNGHTTWAEEVKPEMTVDMLYQREILDITPRALTRPDLQPTTDPPTDLHGYRKVTPQ